MANKRKLYPISNKFLFLCLTIFCLDSIYGQTSQDSTIQFLNTFYEHYIAYCCYDEDSTFSGFIDNRNIPKIDCSEKNRRLLVDEFCTIELRDMLDSLQESYALDYDPFINAQFCPQGIYSFSITQTDFPNWYQMTYYDEDSERHRVVHLMVDKVSGFCKISNVRDFHKGGSSDILESKDGMTGKN